MNQDQFSARYGNPGPHTFLLTRHWARNERSLTVLRQDPANGSTVTKQSVTVHDAVHPMSSRAEWTDDLTSENRAPRSYGYCAPLNEKQLHRARTLGHQWLTHLQVDEPPTEAGPYTKEIQFYARIAEEFTCWYRKHNLSIPKDATTGAEEVETSFSKRLADIEAGDAGRHRSAVQRVLSSGKTLLGGRDHIHDVEEIAEAVADEVKDIGVNGGDQLWDVDDVADYLGVSRRKVDSIIAEGKIKPMRVGRQRRFTREAIEAYLENSVGTNG